MDETGVGKTNRLISEWAYHRKRADRLESELINARTDRDLAATELGKWIVPADIHPPTGSWFNLWVGSGVLRAMKTATGTYEVQWARKPDGKDADECSN